MQNSFSSPREAYEGTSSGEKTDKKQKRNPSNADLYVKIGCEMDIDSKSHPFSVFLLLVRAKCNRPFFKSIGRLFIAFSK